jgi:4'-phosphopantetheinyl transferase
MPVVSVNYVFNKNPLWEKNSVIKKTAEDRIDIWRIAVLENTGSFKYLHSLLNTAEAEKCSRFHKEDDKRRFLISRAVLKVLAGEYLNQIPFEVQIKESLKKKPFVESGSQRGFHFNLSHSGDWILIAVSGDEVGIDIEVKDDFFAYNEIMLPAFSVSEVEFVSQSHQQADAFYLLWTRKEALLKATGYGIADNLSLIPSLNGVHIIEDVIMDSSASWSVNSFAVDENHIGSLACKPDVKTIRYLDITSVLSGKLNTADS